MNKYKVNVNTLGKIMQDVYDTASMSENITWFVENEDFENKFTQEDLDEFNKDIETIRLLCTNSQDIDGVFECLEKYDPSEDTVAIIYGAFLGLVSDKDNKLQTTELITSFDSSSEELSFFRDEDELEREIIHRDFEEFFPYMAKCDGSEDVFRELPISDLKDIEAIIKEREEYFEILKKNQPIPNDMDMSVPFENISRLERLQYRLSTLSTTQEVLWAHGKIETSSFVEWYKQIIEKQNENKEISKDEIDEREV